MDVTTVATLCVLGGAAVVWVFGLIDLWLAMRINPLPAPWQGAFSVCAGPNLPAGCGGGVGRVCCVAVCFAPPPPPCRTRGYP